MNILLINGSHAFAHSGGRLNDTLHAVAEETLTTLGHITQATKIADGYDETEEVEKILRADSVIYQMPAWWMGAPWSVKKYIDDVFTAGHGKLYQNDGRTRSDPSRQYGTGGLLEKKTYMLSVTWNAPLEAFNEFGNFFDGRGVEGVYYPFHKSQQFLGFRALPSFMVNDVIKNPQLPSYLSAYKAHLNALYG